MRSPQIKIVINVSPLHRIGKCLLAQCSKISHGRNGGIAQDNIVP